MKLYFWYQKTITSDVRLTRCQYCGNVSGLSQYEIDNCIRICGACNTRTHFTKWVDLYPGQVYNKVYELESGIQQGRQTGKLKGV